MMYAGVWMLLYCSASYTFHALLSYDCKLGRTKDAKYSTTTVLVRTGDHL